MTVGELIKLLSHSPDETPVVLDLGVDTFLTPTVVVDEGSGVRIVLDTEDEESALYAEAIKAQLGEG